MKIKASVRLLDHEQGGTRDQDSSASDIAGPFWSQFDELLRTLQIFAASLSAQLDLA